MRIIGRLVAWTAVLGMPGIAWVLAHIAWVLWNGRGTVFLVDDFMAMGAAGCGAAVAGYLAVTGWAMVMGALLRGGRSVPRAVAALAPASWQRVTAIALGLTMSAGLAGPALASPPETPHVGWAASVTDQQASTAHEGTTLAGPVGWVAPATDTAPRETTPEGDTLAVGFAAAPASAPPPRESAPDTAAAPEDATAVQDSSHTYTVTHGDSLWRISAKLLGPDASDSSINRAWPQLYAANADVVGSDPALIHPGLVLTVPQGLGS